MVGTTIPPAYTQSTTQIATWNSALGQTMASALQNCAGNVQTALSNIQSALGGTNTPSCPLNATLTLSSSCPPPAAYPVDKPTCATPASEIAQNIKLLKTAFCAASCKDQLLSLIQQQLKCVENDANGLSTVAQSINSVYQTNYATIQQQWQAFQSAINDRDAQITFVNNKLNGDTANGSVGLLDLQKSTETMLGTMSTQVQTLNNQQSSLTLWSQSIASQTQAMVMQTAVACAQNTAVAGYQCSRNDKTAHTAVEVILCQYQNNNQIVSSASGYQVVGDAARQAKAASQAAQLQALLSQLFSLAPSGATIPQNQDAATSTLTGSQAILSDKQLYNSPLFAQLSSYTIGSTNAGAMLRASFAYCYSLAQADVTNQTNSPSGAIYQAKFAQSQAQKAFNASINPFALQYASQIAQLNQTLTNLNSPVNLSSCGPTASSQAQIACIGDMETQMNGLLYGNTTGTPTSITVKGIATNFPVSCSGVNGCIVALQDVSKNLVADKGTLTQDQTNYVRTQNQNMVNFTQRMAAQISGPAQTLNANLAQLKTALQSLGGKLSYDNYQATPLTPGGDEGINQPPADCAALIGGSVTPAPLVDAKTITAEMPASESDSSKILALINENSKLPATCAISTANALLQSASTAGGASGCQTMGFCGGSDQFTELTSVIAAITSNPMVGNFGPALSTGLRNACSPLLIGDGSLQVSANTPPAMIMPITAAANACSNYYASFLGSIKRASELADSATAEETGLSGF